MNSTFVYYTHSDYKDVWPILIGQNQKYLPDANKILISDTGFLPDGDNWGAVSYNPKLPYQGRVLEGLNKIKKELIIFHHEDMFLLDKPDLEKINLIEALVSNNKIDLVKLTGALDTSKRFNDYLVYTPNNLLFSIQPTICKISTLKYIYENVGGNSIWEFEVNAGSFCNGRYSGMMVNCIDDKKRGMYHWDSKIYPYVGTGVVKGKWNSREYQELHRLFFEYNIDYNIRGEV